MTTPIRIAGFVLLGLLAGSPALAETSERIALSIDFATVYKLERPAATVIIGNSGIADATVKDGETLVLTGKASGTTNMIILDEDGEEITNALVEVGYRGDAVTTVYYGRDRRTFACVPKCEAIVAVGDENAHFASANSQNQQRKAFSGTQ